MKSIQTKINPPIYKTKVRGLTYVTSVPLLSTDHFKELWFKNLADVIIPYMGPHSADFQPFSDELNQEGSSR